MHALAGALLHHYVGMHAAKEMTGHVAEEDVVTRRKLESQRAYATRSSGFEFADLGLLQRLLVERHAIRPQWQPGSARGADARDDQLVLVRSLVVHAQSHFARGEMRGRRDLEVLLGHADGAAATGGLRRTTATGERREENGKSDAVAPPRGEPVHAMTLQALLDRPARKLERATAQNPRARAPAPTRA